MQNIQLVLEPSRPLFNEAEALPLFLSNFEFKNIF